MPQSESNREGESHSDDEDESESQSGGSQRDDLTHMLIREGQVIESVSKLKNPDSIESEVARSRGGGELVSVERDTRESGKSTSTVEMEEGKLQSETGYYMHFVTQAQKQLSIYDLVALPQSTAYPVSEQTFNSLPQWAQEKVEREGHIKFNAIYDRESSTFRDVQQGWQREMNHLDRLIQLTDDLDGDIVSAAYYLASEHGSEEFSHAETIAEARDIKPDSVKDSIRKVENQL